MSKRTATIDSRKRVYDGHFKVDVSRVTVDEGDGSPTRAFSVEMFERGDSACALLHRTDDDTIILTEQFRLATLADGDGWMLESPAGSVEDGEEPEACIRRELLEEVGYRAGAMTPIAKFYASPGGTSERVFLYYAPVVAADLVNPDAHGVVGESERITTIAIPRAKLLKDYKAGKILDAKLIVAMAWLARQKARKA